MKLKLIGFFFILVNLFDLSFNVSHQGFPGPLLSYSLPGIGSVSIAQIILILLLFEGISKNLFDNKNLIAYNSRINIIHILFRILIFIMIFYTLRAAFIDSLEIFYLAQMWRYLMFYLFFFILLWFIDDFHKLTLFYRIIIITVIISSLLNIVQFIFQIDIPVGNQAKVDDGFFRIYSSGQKLQLLISSIAWGFIISDKRNRRRYILIFVIVTFAQFVSYSRSHYIAQIIGMTVVTILLLRYKRNKYIKFITIAIGLILTLFIVNFFLNNLLWSRVSSGYTEFLNDTGTSQTRSYLLESRARNIRSNMFLGKGFSITEVYNETKDVGINITGDNGIANILIVYGVFGIVIYSLIFLTTIIKAFILQRKIQNTKFKIILIGIIAFQIQIISVSYISDSFFYAPGIITMVTSWALIILIERILLYNIHPMNVSGSQRLSSILKNNN